MVGGPWAASCSEDCHEGHDGAAATPDSAGSPRFAWTGRLQGAVAIGPVGCHWVVAHVAAGLQQGEATGQVGGHTQQVQARTTQALSLSVGV